MPNSDLVGKIFFTLLYLKAYLHFYIFDIIGDFRVHLKSDAILCANIYLHLYQCESMFLVNKYVLHFLKLNYKSVQPAQKLRQ